MVGSGTKEIPGAGVGEIWDGDYRSDNLYLNLMWSYYGAKTNIVDLYPPPKFGKIIEPFAGSARYALKYFDREVLLVDKYPVIVDIWHWLQECSPKDILSMPRRIEHGQPFESFKFDCLAQRNLFSFLTSSGDAIPRNKPTMRKTVDRPNHLNYSIKRIAESLFKIKHWKIELEDYVNIPNQNATWFIDPPYEFGGQVYKMSNKKIDFKLLSKWCKSREGHVIVCENTKATWMDFKPVSIQKGSNAITTEAIWSNYPTAYDNTQAALF